MPMYFDTHAHYDDEAFDSDRMEILADLFTAEIDGIINPGCDVKSSETAAELSGKFDNMYFAAGIHPENLSDYTEGSLLKIEKLAMHPKCVAIGEIGLDYYWDTSQKDLQKKVFSAQCELAVRLDKPVIVHDRDAHADSFETVCSVHGLRGVFHCYSGSAEMARELLKCGWFLGFDGPITYKNARKTLEVLETCPLDRILIETDSPYLSPVPKRGTRNDSSNLKYIVEKIAEIKNLKPEEISAISADNARRLFGLK